MSFAFYIKRLLIVAVALFIAKKGYDFFALAPEPTYRVVSEHNDFQIREYGHNTFASVFVKGPLHSASNEGFRYLADYIFAKSASYKPIPMTAPVLVQSKRDGWVVRFVLPDGMTEKHAPTPLNKIVQLSSAPKRKVAVAHISGAPSQQQWSMAVKKLEKALENAGLTPCSKPWFARYNPPWIPPFMRRNEVMVVVK